MDSRVHFGVEMQQESTGTSEGDSRVSHSANIPAQVAHLQLVEKEVAIEEGGVIIDRSGGEIDVSNMQIIKNEDLEELRELEAGTVGTVYRGKWGDIDVAIKRINKSCFTGQSSERDRLILESWREARIHSKLQHQNIVSFHGVVQDEVAGISAIVAEFMVDGSLRNVLLKKDRNLDHCKRLIIAVGAASGMEYLHCENIIHFDLRCDNLFVDLKDPSHPICKVGGFGLSQIKSNTLALSCTIRGIIPWIAPELLNGSSDMVSEKVDVFSFGIVMWEILTGEEPYGDMHFGQIIGGILSNKLRPPVPASCDPEWRRLMEECWDSDPQQRPSFTQIVNRLNLMPLADQTYRENKMVAKPITSIIKNEDLVELRELGSGTFGTVYHGKWGDIDVAIKRLNKSSFRGHSFEQERPNLEFWQEVEILSNLQHPNVVAFYGVVQDGPGDTLATVTEFMVDGSLGHALLCKDKCLDYRKRLIIAMDAAFGMEYLHYKNIVHFDLKSDNLLVNFKDQSQPICKVADFGLSKNKQDTPVSGSMRGTLPWMAPELLNGRSNEVSEKVDVYSFGIVMWEILTGEEPYADMHHGEIIGGIVNNTLRPPVPASCDPEWRCLMEQCWASDPQQRPSFTQIVSTLCSMSEASQAEPGE